MLETYIPLKPKNPDGKLSVVAIGRISTPGQNVENIDASHRYVREYLQRIYDGPMELTLLGEQASGMLVDRTTIREAEEMVARGEVDLVIAEDLARIYRNPRHQYSFVQDCVDAGVRVICVGDNLDTGDPNWEVTMGTAALRHGLFIPDVRRRVARTATHAFHGGGMVQRVKYGYRKLSAEKANSGEFGPKGLRITKVPECTPVLRQMMDRVMRGAKYAAVADWLNSEGVEPGPYVESGRWMARLVVDLLDDPILSGTRTFRKTIYRLIFRTGKHQVTSNEKPETEHCPELAHLSGEEHDALRCEIARRRAAHPSKNGQPGHRPHYLPRSRTIWPGQAVTCAVCGGLMYYMGKHLRCRNSLPGGEQSCWNHLQFSAEVARRRIVEWLAAKLDNIPSSRDLLTEAVWKIVEPTWKGVHRRERDLEREIASLEKQSAHLAEAVAEGGELKVLVQKLRSVEASLKQSQRKKAAAHRQSRDEKSAMSKQQLKLNLGEKLYELIGSSFELADLMRQIFPEFVIQPVQAIDSGLVRPRAKFTLQLSAIADMAPLLGGSLIEFPDVQDTLDLFDPPLHIRYLPECLATRRQNPRFTLKQIAAELGINYMTVKRAFDCDRRMQAEGLSQPYRKLRTRPERASRWRDRRKA